MDIFTPAPAAVFAPKRRLQVAIALAACVPVAAGLAGMIAGPAWLGDPAPPSMAGHFRYLSGLLFGLGVMFWTAVPQIEREGRLVRALSGMVILGGLARLFGLFADGAPTGLMRYALVMELLVTPALCLWQWRLARRMDGALRRR